MNDVAVCVPCSRMDEPIPDSAHEPCTECGVECWVSPSTELIRARNPGLRIMCSDCGVTFMLERRGRFHRLEGDQVAELIESGMTLEEIRHLTQFFEHLGIVDHDDE